MVFLSSICFRRRKLLVTFCVIVAAALLIGISLKDFEVTTGSSGILGQYYRCLCHFLQFNTEQLVQPQVLASLRTKVCCDKTPSLSCASRSPSSLIQSSVSSANTFSIDITNLVLRRESVIDNSQQLTDANNITHQEDNSLVQHAGNVNNTRAEKQAKFSEIVDKGDDVSEVKKKDSIDEMTDGENDSEYGLEALIDAGSSNKYVGNLPLAKLYDSPLLTLCQITNKKSFATNSSNKQLTHEECRRSCGKNGSSYAILSRGQCKCTEMYEHKAMVNLESCNATCTSDEPDCNLTTRPHNIVMGTGLFDGHKEWTKWMNLPELSVRVRYRGCLRSKDKTTDCVPEFERKQLHKSPLPDVAKHLIGCFTGYMMSKNSSIRKEATRITYGGLSSHEQCRKFCRERGTNYAYLNTNTVKKFSPRKCFCADTLATSQPTDSCSGMGYAVYWSNAHNSEVVLQFNGEVKKKGKVLVLARYRSGSSMTQSFFIKYPNSFTLFEPCRLKPPSKAAGIEETDRAMMKAIEAAFSCDIHKVPAAFYNSKFLRWSAAMLSTRGQSQNHLLKVLACFQFSPAVDCAPYWLEACQISEFINIKIIRVFSVAAIREFIEKNLDVHVVHLVRDPRGLLAAQRKFGAKPVDSFLCNQLVEIGKLVRDMKREGRRNVHEVYYEELAVNASYYGAKMYSEMAIEMPEQVQHFLNREDYEGEPIPKSAQQVLTKDPISHVYGYLNRYPLERILEIDKHCANVYNHWPAHYAPFWTVYKNHKSDIYKYAWTPKLQQISQYIKSHPKLLT